MTDRELINRLLFLAQTAVDQALNLDYDDPEDYFVWRELQELKAAVAALAVPEPVGPTASDVTELFYRHMGEGSEVGFESAITEALARWGR